MNIAEVRGYAPSSSTDPPPSREFHTGIRRLLKRDVVLILVEIKDGK